MSGTDQTGTRAVACLGIGNVGRSWAEVFVRAGYKVRLWDADPAKAQACAADLSERFGPDWVTVATTPVEAVAGAAYVQESIIEDLASKRVLYEAIDDALAADAILASSTSAIPASQLFESLASKARCLVAHPVNPPHLIPLVELSGAPFTAPETIARTREVMLAVGQQPIEIRGEIEGFALNRLQWALLAEALHLVEQGYCTPQEVDMVLTHGLARRWVRYGPFATGHLNSDRGVEGYFTGLASAMERVWSSLDAPKAPSPELVERIHKAIAGERPVDQIRQLQAERDHGIARLNAFLSEPSDSNDD